jgi:hypothetical protein
MDPSGKQAALPLRLAGYFFFESSMIGFRVASTWSQ